MDAQQPGSTSTPWFGVSMALLGVIVGYAVASAQAGFGYSRPGAAPAVVQNPPGADAPAPAPPPAAPLPPVDPATDHIRGNPQAPVTVVEYSDFECPFCKRHDPTMRKILSTYGDDVNWVFRHFPLTFHENAQKEAEASECAAELGGNDAFWKYHDALFDRTTSNGTGFALDQLVPLAKELGLNEAKFRDCLDSGTFAQKVTDQQNAGMAAGVQGTPGNFVLNNKTQEQKDVSGAVPFSTFQSIIDPMLAQ